MADITIPKPVSGALAQAKAQMERTLSEDIREEREDLKEAAEFTQSVVVELSIEKNVRWLSPSWREIVGTDPNEVLGKPISTLIVSDSTIFDNAIESIRKDDSRSHNVRFTLVSGPSSALRRKLAKKDGVDPDSLPNDLTLDLEGQGIMIYDRTTGKESHTMWMLKPYVTREITIDLPDVLVENLGVGAEILARFLTTLAEEGVTDHKSYPRPPPVLCRICERQITAWWFEKHTELCLQEHTAERDVQFGQENLTELRKSIVKVLDALEFQTRQPRATSLEPPAAQPIAEYKGFTIGSSPTPTSLGSPAATPSRSRERPVSGFGHHRARSFAVRRPIPRIVELLLDLCDTAVEINMPAIKDIPGQPDGEVRTQSPESESRISQVLQWQSPSTSTVEQDQGLMLLCEDTSKLAKGKVDAVFRYRGILEYSERIRIEFENLITECIETAVEKAAKIAAGELSDSSEDQVEEQEEEEENINSPEVPPSEDSIFPCSLDAPSAMAEAIRNASRRSMAVYSDVPTSTAASTRSNSPRGARTPRSHIGAPSVASLSKRASMHLDSMTDGGADSDSSAPSYSRHGPRAESPVSELSLSRVSTTRENKRRSLILPSSKMGRQQSPARSMPPPPSSPLRMAKTRVASGTEASQSPITSPVLVNHEFSSPALPSHLQTHRRQSSANSSDIIRSTSPRPAPVASHQQPRAAPPSIKDFEIIKPISKGAFGSVFLAKKKTTNEYFAIKALKKADMVAKNQVTNVKAERAIMMWQGESEFVAKLYWTFANKEFLFLVMEYLNGGDCASLVKSLGGLPEEWSKRYLAEVVLGVEHLHSRGIVHRDLKPDNLLIDSKGHLKLTDFGLSRMGIVGRQKRAVASPEETPVPDLLKQGPFQRVTSNGSSRSASFDFHGGASSPSQTPSMTSTMMEFSQPSYFNLNRETSRRPSGTRSESENSDGLNAMFRRFSIVDDALLPQSQSPIEEETDSQSSDIPDTYALHPTYTGASQAGSLPTPPNVSATGTQNLALFDPEDSNRKFVGTPDYLAPETINGVGQDELSDWWSLGCILFEFLYGYPPFHADTPDEVFQNILARNILWPPAEEDDVSVEAKDLMNRLMCTDQQTRLGANAEGKYATGAEEIRNHVWFADMDWDALRDAEASFVPQPENPEDTEYFDTRGATLQNFTQFDEPDSSPVATPSGDYPDRPHDALSRVRSQVNSIKRGLIPLHIPPHVRDGRSRRLSEPVPTDDFGNFNFKNLPVLEKANKDVIQKLKAEAMQAQNKSTTNLTSPITNSPQASLDSSPVLPMPLKRALSVNKGTNRPLSPSLFTNQPVASPNRGSQPSSPLLVQFSTGHHERRKTSSSSSSLSVQTSNSLQPGSFFDGPRLPASFKPASGVTSPIKLAKSPGPIIADRGASLRGHMTSNPSISPRGRSLTISSQESEDVIKDLKPEHKRRSAIMDVSPSSSDNEDTRQRAFLRVQRRRQSSHRLSQITLSEGPVFRPLDVLVCEDHPVSRLVMEKLLERLRCRTVTASSGTEASRYAMSEVKFDIIFTEARLPQLSGSDFARMVRRTKNTNSTTPIVAVTGYLKELPPNHFFDGLIEKPPTIQKLTDILGRLCQWKPAPPVSIGIANSTVPAMPWPIPAPALAHLRYGTLLPQEDSPTSFSSGFPTMPSGSYRGSSREDSISSSFFGDADSRAGVGQAEEPVIVKQAMSDADWQERDLARNFEGLGITGHDEHELNAETKSLNLLSSPPTQPERMSPPSSGLAPRTLVLPPPARSITSSPVETTPLKKKRSGENKLQQRNGRASGESGDDEDEELGMRAKSPRNRPRGTSKLGTEMLRTNSRGSVISVDGPDLPPLGSTSKLETIISPEVVIEEMLSPEPPESGSASPLIEKSTTVTPPSGEMSELGVPSLLKDLETTPRGPTSKNDSPIDPDPTPKPTIFHDPLSQAGQPSAEEGKQEDQTANPSSAVSDQSPTHI
jgi:serine/threonine-protein kinase RIM15